MTANDLKSDVVRFARESGIDLVGVTTAEPFDRFLSELATRKEAYRDRYAYRLETWWRMGQPRQVLRGAKAVLVVGFSYLAEESPQPPASGKIGRIVAYGHEGILKRTRLLCAFLRSRGYRAKMGLHRKEAAVRAGLGVIGKHNLVINPEFGSWVAYQSIVTDAPLPPDEPATGEVCGQCDACLKACPTGALYEARRLDPRRCVTCMLTSRQVAPEHWPALGPYILGCDVCQEACPKNRGVKLKARLESLLSCNMGIYPSLQLLLDLDEIRFRREVIHPIQEKFLGNGWQARLLKQPAISKMLTWTVKHLLRGKELLPETFVHAADNLKIYQRNALIAAGNMRCRELRASIERHLPDEQLKPYAVWALEKIGP